MHQHLHEPTLVSRTEAAMSEVSPSATQHRASTLLMSFADITATERQLQRSSASSSRQPFTNSPQRAQMLHLCETAPTATMTTTTTTTTRGFCDEEVDILSYLLLDEPALGTEEFFPTFPPTSFFPGPQQRGVAPLFSVQELFGPDLLVPLDAAELSFMSVHTQSQTTAAQHDSSRPVYTSNRVQRQSTKARERLIDAACRKAQDEAAANSHSRICSVSGCMKSSQSRGRCIRHGGGKRCSVPECTRGAQATGRCKAHGGGVRCSVDGCEKSSQGSGLCRTHGGGKICVFPGCKKGTQRGGKCSTHGGARICSVDGCEKVDRGGGLCGAHKKAKAHKAMSSFAGN